MRDELAEEVLAKVMEWRPDEVAEYGSQLQLLAAHKYDSYEGYRPGVKFLESLTGLLSQFENVEDRRTIVRFVLQEMVFISRAELDHLIETVYPRHIRPMLLAEAATALGVSEYARRRIAESDEFRAIRRKLLILGLSDGARVDRLRRSSPELSHEQIYLATDIATETAEDARKKLAEALGDENARFEHVLLVDDFYGSGFTLLRERTDGAEPFTGRLWRTKGSLRRFEELGIIARDARVTVLVYVASEDAENYVNEMLRRAELPWDFYVVHRLDANVKVTSVEMQRICESHYDPILVDHAKPRPYPLGYRDAALPLVLPHNTPNNSIGILWADTTDRPAPSLKRRALFPRYERHRDDRR